MNICHIYSGISDTRDMAEILNSFDESISISIDQIENLGEYGVYIINIEQITKELTTKLKNLFILKIDPLIYFIIHKTHSLPYFQLAFMLKSKTIITQSQDTQMIIRRIKTDFKEHKKNHMEYMLGKSLLKGESYLFFRDKKLIYTTKKFMKEFKCESLLEIEEKIFSQIDIDELLRVDDVKVTSINIFQGEKKSFFIKSSTLDTQERKVIYFEPYVHERKNSNQLEFVSSRTSFIELLKDKVLERSISEGFFSIITIQVENIKMPDSDLNKIETEQLINDLLQYINSVLDKKLILAQFDMEFYATLFEDISFEELTEIAQNLYSKIKEFMNNQKLKPLITLFALDINSLELNEILVTLENISLKKLPKDQLDSDFIKSINNMQENMSDKERIDLHLQSTYLNGSEFKLLNIYKGLCINTSSKIIKKTDESIYIRFEHMQGLLMRNEKETVLQSSEYIKDIKATVKYVDIQKKFAVLNNFKFLNTNANERKYGRVTCSSRTPIVISNSTTTLQGEIADISIKSVAIKARYTKRLEDIESKDVLLNFILPLRSHAEGFIKLNLKAKVLFSICDENICKIVCDLYEDIGAESAIMEYVYNRQKELIVEVKKMVKTQVLNS